MATTRSKSTAETAATTADEAAARAKSRTGTRETVEWIAEQSRASHGTVSDVRTRTVLLTALAVLIIVAVAMAAIWVGASFPGGEPGITAPKH